MQRTVVVVVPGIGIRSTFQQLGDDALLGVVACMMEGPEAAERLNLVIDPFLEEVVHDSL